MSVGSFSNDDGDGNENVAAVTFVNAKKSLVSTVVSALC